MCTVQVMWFSRKWKKHENNKFYTQNHNLLKIENKSLMRAPIRAEKSDYVKLRVFIIILLLTKEKRMVFDCCDWCRISHVS